MIIKRKYIDVRDRLKSIYASTETNNFEEEIIS